MEGGEEGEEEEAKLWHLYQVLQKLPLRNQVMLGLPSHQVVHLAPYQLGIACALWLGSQVV